MTKEVEKGFVILSIEKTIFFYMQKTRKKFCLWRNIFLYEENSKAHRYIG